MANVTRHSAILIAAYVLTSLLNYGFGVGLSWFFNPVQFGILGVTQSMLLLLALAAGSGFAWTAAHDIASLGLTTDTRKRLRTAFLANGVLGLILGLGLWLAYAIGLLPLGDAYRWVIPLAALTITLLSLRAVLNGVARGLYHFGSVAFNLVLEVVVKVLIGLALVAFGGDVVMVMLAFAGGALIALAHSLWMVRHTHIFEGSGWIDMRVISSTLPLFVGMISTAIILNLDVIGLKLLSPADQGDILAGYYQAAVILARTPVFIAQAIALVLFSYVAGNKYPSIPSKTNTAPISNPLFSLKDGYVQSIFYTWLRLLLPASLALILAPKTALSILFPPTYHGVTGPLQVSAFGCLLVSLITLLNGVLQAAGNRRNTALAIGAGMMAQVIVLALTVQGRGVIGASLSLVVAGSVSLVGILPSLRSSIRSFKPALWTGPSRILFECVPYLALSLPLLVIPDGSRMINLFKFSLSALLYLAVLYALRVPLANATKKSLVNYINQFIQVLMGG